MNSFLNSWGGLLIYFLVVLSLAYICWRFYKFLFRSRYIFGDRLETRIAGLALTSLFFRNGVMVLFVTPVRILYFALVELYNSLSAVTGAAGKTGQGGDGIRENMTRLLTNLYNDIPFYTVTDVFLALAFWTICGQLINSFANAGKNNGSTAAVMPDTIRQKLILGLLFLLSIYLSFASIITVPYFSENDKVEVSKDLLKSKLDATKESFKNYAAPLDKPAPANTIDSSFPAKIKTLRHPVISSQIQQVFDNMQDAYISNTAARQKANTLLETIKRDMTKDLDEQYASLQNRYQVEEPNLKSKQKLSYINALAGYYNDRVKTSIGRSNDVLQVVDEGDNLLGLAQRNFNLDFSSLLAQAAAADTGEVTAAAFKVDYYSLRLTMRNYYEGLTYINYNSGTAYMQEAPQPPAAGDELGIFKSISQWLIKPHSMSLVLITGMLGFGLFGAAISTFVRESRRAQGFSTIAVVDITGILIKGVSAAIVIFLAVKGGLAVFSSGDAEPNPYALFFTCLVGAVYSEKIWKWAQDKLLQNFNEPGEHPKTPGEKDTAGDKKEEENAVGEKKE